MWRVWSVIISLVVAVAVSSCIPITDNPTAGEWTRVGPTLRMVDSETGIACYLTPSGSPIGCARIR